MILECTECHTRYLVPDTAIGVDGRTVRCASCKHSWFQDGIPALDLVARAEAASPIAHPAEAPQAAPVAAVDTAAPSNDTTRFSSPAAETAHSDYDAFAHQPPFRARRNPARRATLAALVAGGLMLAAVAGILYTGAPGIASDLFRPAAGTPLKIVSKPIDQHVFNGNEIFAVSGTVLNPTDSPQPIPDIRADLRDAQRRIVFSWIIRPEATMLPPKGSIEFNSAKLDVPVNAKELVLSFSGEAAH
ncbi:MJ0042-type zinc finger domain-containing protein [Sphingomonas sp. RB3P16]|uniref:MJ0042-type zinc finger domain-containing protein n=1 Tax=Parasphingomonas frigoris TaxID=3096163 RepID=UPI002FC89E7A